MKELDNMGGVLPLRLKDTNVGISFQWHNGSVGQSIKVTDAMVYHVEWLSGEPINFKCTQMFLPLESSNIRSTYTVEEFRYLVSRVVSVPPTLLEIVFQPLQPRNGGHMLIETMTDTKIDTMTCSSGSSSDSAKSICSITRTCVAAKDPISIQVHVAVAMTSEYLVYADQRCYKRGRCLACFCKLSLGGCHVVLDVGLTRKSHNNVVWTGQNEYCDMCFATGTFIHLYMPDDCEQRRRNIEVLGKAARWIKTIAMVDDILENIEEVD